MATKALIECTSVYFDGCFFYIDRSRKVPPTFFLGEPQGLPLLYKQTKRSVSHYEKTIISLNHCHACYGRYHYPGWDIQRVPGFTARTYL